MVAKKQYSAAWTIAVYKTPDARLPALEFLSTIPAAVRRELDLTITAVVQVGPSSFRGGSRWTVMHKPKKKGEVNMSGIFEARDKHSKLLYRLFCVVDGQGAEHGLGGPAVVLLDGVVKPVATAVPQADYRRIDEYRDDYRATRRVATRDASTVNWWPDPFTTR